MRNFLQRFAVSFCILFLLQEVHPLIVIPKVENENVDERRVRKDVEEDSANVNNEITGVAVHSRKKSKWFVGGVYMVFILFSADTWRNINVEATSDWRHNVNYIDVTTSFRPRFNVNITSCAHRLFKTVKMVVFIFL